MPKQRIEELIEGVSKEDVKDDNGQDSISLETEKAQQARMFSLSQLHSLFHLLLRKSNARYRLDKNDIDTAVLQKKVAEL